MSQRLQKGWIVLESVINQQQDRCVDFFRREDGTIGFEEFRRDVEDGGRWTPVQYYAATQFATLRGALTSAERNVLWLARALEEKGPSPKIARMSMALCSNPQSGG